MPNQYILSADYAAFGLPNTTTQQQVIMASLIIDNYLNKPAGLLYEVDINGNPIYMSGLNPDFTLTATSSIAPGNSVTIPVTGALSALNSGSTYGQTVVIDRGNSALQESCVIQSIDLVNRTVTLAHVQFSHASGILLETGLSIFEERFLQSARSVCNVSYTPVRMILAAQGTFTYPRHGDSIAYSYNTISPFAFFAQLNDEPIYQVMDATAVQFNSVSGIVYLPNSFYGNFYNDVRIYYIAGWTYTSLPASIKQACALIVNLGNSTNISDNVVSPITKYRAGGTEIDFANAKNSTATIFYQNNSIASLLDPYRRTMI